MSPNDYDYTPTQPNRFLLDGAILQSFFDTLLEKLKRGAFEEAAMMYRMPLRLQVGKQSSTALSYADLFGYLKMARSHHDPELHEAINVFGVKATSDNTWQADLEWSFATDSGMVAAYSRLRYELVHEADYGYRITRINVLETTKLDILDEIPLVSA